jgi:mitosis inhibitor protein kinase SWE1
MKRNSSSNRLHNAAAFPGSAQRGYASPASSSDAGSPRTRRRTNGNATLPRLQTNQLPQIFPPRAPLSRIESGSSATLFFGSPIPPAQTLAPTARSRTNTNLSATTPAPVLRRQNTRSNLTNRHSYAGPESSANALHAWNTFQTRNVSPSPRSSPCGVGDGSRHRDTDMETDEDMFFGPDSSFVLNVTSETPSPQSKTALPMKFKHRNSVLISDEDDIPSTGSSNVGDFLQAMPKASISVTSICSDEGLMTPGAVPEGYSDWPTATIYVDVGDNQHPYGLTSEAGVDVDAFIIKTLAAASKGPHLLPKRIPGTPVKKVRMSYFGNERPWQSAVASKVGLRDDCDFNKKKKVPRKSLPAAFPAMGATPSCDQTTDSEDEQESPITRREKYANLGLGQPSGKNGVSGIPRSRWLMRRSSSGAFSSGSDSASLANTPTRSKGIGKEKRCFRVTVTWILTRCLSQ